MRLADLSEAPPLPPAPPPADPDLPPSEALSAQPIAEAMIEAEAPPEEHAGAPGAEAEPEAGGAAAHSWDDFLPMHRVAQPPRFDEGAIAAALVFPPIALRSGIEGRVILELFVDRNGVVQLARVLREDPEGRGFGEAAQRAFLGRQGSPAIADGAPVSSRFRYPVSFRIR